MNKAVIIISKILEVCHWVGCGFMIVFTIALAVGKDNIIYQLSDISSTTDDVDMYGLSISTNADGPIPFGCFMVFFIAGIIIMALMALVFRNIYLIFKTAEGKTKFSEGATPFQASIVKMTRQIGIFCLAIPAVEFIISIIAGIAFGQVDASVEFSTLFFGLIILCLSRFFAYGLELQKDTEGLV